MKRRETGRRPPWTLTAQEVAHAMPVLQHVHAGLHRSPAPRLATLRRLAVRCRIPDVTLRVALSRAVRAGSLAQRDGRYRLGPTAVEEARAARALRARVPGYTLGIVVEGVGTDLPRLRTLFGELGLVALQRSVWVGARTVDDRLAAALRRTHLETKVVAFQADEVDTDARARLAKRWGLARRAAKLRRFHDELLGYLTAPGLSDDEAAWRCVEAAPVWYRTTVHDEPPFPLDLCGDDYPLERLNEAWRAHLVARTPALIALWRHEEQR